MTRNIAFALIALPLTLAACGTPQERCIAKNTSEYRSVARLLAEVEGNLSRGYAWEERQVVDTVLTDCRRVRRDSEGNAQVYYETCWRDVVDTQRYRVAIDPAVEQRKRDNLAAKLAQLNPRAAAAVSACRAAYPEES